ncbi:MAG: hypothetical protein WD993_10285 [Thermoleophilaceae bacterium]
MTMPFGRSLSTIGAAVAIAGCGGAEEPPDLPATASAGEPLTIEAREYVFAPNRVKLRGASGTVRQRIVLDNVGDLAHDIEILDGDRVVDRLRSFPAGQARSVSVRLRPGSYRFVCTVADHDEKGMRGTLEVR